MMTNIPVSVLPSPLETVTLTSTTDPSFLARAENLLNGTISTTLAVSELALPALRQSVGPGDRRLRVSFEAKGPNFRVCPQFKYPEALYRRQTKLADRDQELLPGEERLVGPYFQLNPNIPFSEEYIRTLGEWLTREALRETRGLKLGLDAVIFEDGRALGLGASTLKNSFAEHLEAVRSLYVSISGSVRSGATLAEALQRTSPPLPMSGVLTESDAYANVALNSLKRLARNHGDKAIEAYLQQVSNRSPIVLR